MFDSSSKFHSNITFSNPSTTLDISTANTYPILTWYFIAATIRKSGNNVQPVICVDSSGTCNQVTYATPTLDALAATAPENVTLTIGHCQPVTGAPQCMYATYGVRFYNTLNDCPSAGQYCSDTSTPITNPNLLFYMPLISNEYLGGWLGNSSTFLDATPFALYNYPIYPQDTYRYTEQQCPPGTYYNYIMCATIPNLLRVQRNATQFGFIPIPLATTDEWTIEGWVITIKATDNSLVSLMGVGSTVNFYEVRYQQTNNFFIYALTNASMVNSAGINIAPYSSNWHFVSLVLKNNSPYTAFQCKLNVWGDIGQPSVIATINTSSISSTSTYPLQYLYLGGNFYDPTVNHTLAYYKHIRLWKEPLSESTLVLYARNSLVNADILPTLLIFYDFTTANSSYITNLADKQPYDAHFFTYTNTSINGNFYAPADLVSMYTISTITTPKTIQTCPLNYRYDIVAFSCVMTEDFYPESMQSTSFPQNAVLQAPIPEFTNVTSDDFTFEVWLKITKWSGSSINLINSDLGTGLAVKRYTIATQLSVTVPTYSGSLTTSLTSAQGFSLYTWLHLELVNTAYINSFCACISQNCSYNTAQVSRKIAQSVLYFGDSNPSNILVMYLREFRLWSIPRSSTDISNSMQK